jgi:hypothetical protein
LCFGFLMFFTGMYLFFWLTISAFILFLISSFISVIYGI